MFNLEYDNRKTGEYPSDLIDKKYKSKREFCRAYLSTAGIEINDDEIRKTANRISQIKKGNKAIQTYDLPIFTKLLNVSCEEILSAGKCIIPKTNRITNYSIAFSRDKKEWEEYINREGSPILNSDEYGKTVLEYAIEFKNYDFLKFLIENEYIWFDGGCDNDYVTTFGAGTKIQRRDPLRADINDLEYKIATDDRLRLDIITLAADQGDITIIEELRARELPELYYNAHYLSCTHPDFESHYDKSFVRNISRSDNEVLNYFTDEFEVRDKVKYNNGSKRKHKFIFPFISELLDFLIEDNISFAESALKKAIKHNQETYETLKQMINISIETEIARYGFRDNEYLNAIRPEVIKLMLKEIDFYRNGNIISFRDTKNMRGIITNIARTKKTSDIPEINRLIDELNGLYEKIRNIGCEVEAEQKKLIL